MHLPHWAVQDTIPIGQLRWSGIPLYRQANVSQCSGSRQMVIDYLPYIGWSSRWEGVLRLYPRQ